MWWIVNPQSVDDFDGLYAVNWSYWGQFLYLSSFMGICWILWPKPLPAYQPKKALVFPTGNIRICLRLLPAPIILYLLAGVGGLLLDDFFPSDFVQSYTYSPFLWNLLDFLLEGVLVAGLFFAIVRMFRRKILIVLSAAAGVWALLWWYDAGREITWIWSRKFPNMGWPAYILYRVPILIALEATAILLMAVPSRSRGAKALESAEDPEPNDEPRAKETP
ncbi:hypothetical protein KQI84_15120 [bacterium]|nr:hypothetical protein [bacterium]